MASLSPIEKEAPSDEQDTSTLGCVPREQRWREIQHWTAEEPCSALKIALPAAANDYLFLCRLDGFNKNENFSICSLKISPWFPKSESDRGLGAQGGWEEPVSQ